MASLAEVWAARVNAATGTAESQALLEILPGILTSKPSSGPEGVRHLMHGVEPYSPCPPFMRPAYLIFVA